MPDFAKQKWRSRFERALLDAGAEGTHEALGDRKQAIIASMTGIVVELGPGTGANMRYYGDGAHVVAIEPNPHMHDRLRAEADEHGVDLEIRSLRGESIDVGDASAGGVVATLLLCGVEDPTSVIAEAHRVLKPGGTYFFVEHVEAAPRVCDASSSASDEATPRVVVQRLPHRPGLSSDHAWRTVRRRGVRGDRPRSGSSVVPSPDHRNRNEGGLSSNGRDTGACWIPTSRRGESDAGARRYLRSSARDNATSRQLRVVHVAVRRADRDVARRTSVSVGRIPRRSHRTAGPDRSGGVQDASRYW